MAIAEGSQEVAATVNDVTNSALTNRQVTKLVQYENSKIAEELKKSPIKDYSDSLIQAADSTIKESEAVVDAVEGSQILDQYE